MLGGQLPLPRFVLATLTVLPQVSGIDRQAARQQRSLHRHRTAALPLDVSAPVRSWPAGVAPRPAGKDIGAANETHVD